MFKPYFIPFLRLCIFLPKRCAHLSIATFGFISFLLKKKRRYYLLVPKGALMPLKVKGKFPIFAAKCCPAKYVFPHFAAKVVPVHFVA